MFIYDCIVWLTYIHIGVGSDVVCSTTIGNARASVRGMDNKTIPRFFYVLPEMKESEGTFKRKHTDMSNVPFLSPLHILQGNFLPHILLCVYRTVKSYSFLTPPFLLSSKFHWVFCTRSQRLYYQPI